jgi:hypothetical protein
LSNSSNFPLKLYSNSMKPVVYSETPTSATADRDLPDTVEDECHGTLKVNVIQTGPRYRLMSAYSPHPSRPARRAHPELGHGVGL